VDARSLLYEADLFVGAGGTMTREAALLGVPALTVFAGRRPAVDVVLERDGAIRLLISAQNLGTVHPRGQRGADLARLRVRGRIIEEIFAQATFDAAMGKTASE
jgi:hypothetical protein